MYKLDNETVRILSYYYYHFGRNSYSYALFNAGAGDRATIECAINELDDFHGDMEVNYLIWKLSELIGG